MQTASRYFTSFSVVILSLTILASSAGTATSSPLSLEKAPLLGSCEDMASRQIDLADTQLRQNSYQRALRVLNRAAENCDIPAVREKIMEVLNQWYGSLRPQRETSSFREFISTVSNQPYISSYQRELFTKRIRESVHQLIQHRFQNDNFRGTYGACRSFPNYVEETFELKYYCGRAAHEVGATTSAIRAYEWLWENWTDDQSYLEWKQLASTLKELYFQSTEFEKAYELTKELAIRDPSPENILTSLIAIRGSFLEPLLNVGTTYFGRQLPSSTREYVQREMGRVKFPPFVESLYLISESGETQTILYGEDEVSPPNPSLLEQTSGASSMLQSADSHVWLVSSLSDGYLALQYDRHTSPEENVHLERLLENTQSNKAWRNLYDHEFDESYPALGSAVATLVGGAYLGDLNMSPFREIFDATPALMYYCIQNASGDIMMSHAFSRSNLGYGTGGWQRTSNTPALFHHSVEYDDSTIREVVWPTYVDEEWNGVTRVGIARR